MAARLTNLVDRLGRDTDVRDVYVADVRRYAQLRKKHIVPKGRNKGKLVSPDTVAKELQAGRALYNFLIRYAVVPETCNPFKEYITGKVPSLEILRF